MPHELTKRKLLLEKAVELDCPHHREIMKMLNEVFVPGRRVCLRKQEDMVYTVGEHKRLQFGEIRLVVETCYGTFLASAHWRELLLVD